MRSVSCFCFSFGCINIGSSPDEKSYANSVASIESQTVPERQRNNRRKPRPNSSLSRSKDPFRSSTGPGNATFLTECSFGVSQDRLIKHITDVAPYEPSWLDLRTVNLSSKGVDSLVKLKDFLPNLDEADLSVLTYRRVLR